MQTKKWFKLSFLLIFVIIAMMCALVACNLGDNDGGIKSFSQLEDKFKVDDAEIKLTQDITSEETLNISKLFTLDLNGKTLTVGSFKVNCKIEGVLTIKNGTFFKKLILNL